MDAQRPSILTIIPARGGSKRLPRKNLLPIAGVPMVVRVAKEAQKLKIPNRVVVSTEDPEIKKVCREANIEVIDRPSDLADDKASKQSAIEHAVKQLQSNENFVPSIVVSLQANTPEFQATDLEKAIEFFLHKVFPDSPIKEVWSVGPDLIQNGAFRIMTHQTVFQRTLSTYVGVFITDYLDIHHLEDLAAVEKRLKERNS